MTRPWYVLHAAIAAALVLVWIVQTIVWPEMPQFLAPAAYAIVVLSSGLSANRLRDRRARTDGVDESAALEHQVATTERAGSFGDLLLACLGLGAIFLMVDNVVAGLGCVVIVIGAIVGVETRTALIRRQQIEQCSARHPQPRDACDK